MKYLLLVCVVLFSARAEAFRALDLNVFDQLQGTWAPDFRQTRTDAVGDYIKSNDPDLVVFEEAKGVLPGAQGGGKDSADAASFEAAYPYRRYEYEMTGADGGAYGYWIGAKVKPRRWIRDKFFFPGGVDRRVLGAVFDHVDGGCLGVVSLHLSYQTSEVRQTEARWLLGWLKAHETLCRRWLVFGDFNADEKDPEMKLLFAGGLTSLFTELKPTVGAYNPIRRIYGDAIPSQTIDWALGWNFAAEASVVLDTPWKGTWVSDHAAVLVETKVPVK